MNQKDKLNKLQDRLGEIFNGIDDFNKEFQSLAGSLNPKPTKKRTTTRSARKTSSAPRKIPSTSRSKSKTLK